MQFSTVPSPQYPEVRFGVMDLQTRKFKGCFDNEQDAIEYMHRLNGVEVDLGHAEMCNLGQEVRVVDITKIAQSASGVLVKVPGQVSQAALDIVSGNQSKVEK